MIRRCHFELIPLCAEPKRLFASTSKPSGSVKPSISTSNLSTTPTAFASSNTWSPTGRANIDDPFELLPLALQHSHRPLIGKRIYNRQRYSPHLRLAHLTANTRHLVRLLSLLGASGEAQSLDNHRLALLRCHRQRGPDGDQDSHSRQLKSFRLPLRGGRKNIVWEA